MGRSISKAAVAFFAVICGVSSADDVAAQVKGPAPDIPATTAGIRAHYASTNAWTASFDGTHADGSGKEVPVKGTVSFRAPDDIVVTIVGGATSKTTCANPGAMIFLCGMSASIMTFAQPLRGYTNQPLVLIGTPANAVTPMTQHFIFYVDRKTFAVSRVTTTSPGSGGDSDIEFTNVVRK